MNKVVAFAALSLLAVGAAPVFADSKDRDQTFFQSVEGQWVGPGEIVAGKYKGTKFSCSLAGSTPSGKVGMTLDGSCRVGVFSQPMKATVVRSGKTYSGSFMDGAKGKGLDIVGGNVSGDRVVFSLNRKQLNGAMVARISDLDTMNVTVSVRLDTETVPVIGMTLKRVDTTLTSSVKKN
ncbi:MAG: hypothetical protein ACRECW_01295 [Phyllobacterium sp.]